MAISRYGNIETIIRNTIFTNGIDHLMKAYGQEVEVFQPTADTFSDVYGTASGDRKYESAGTVEVLATGDSFYPSDGLSSGSFDQGYIYLQESSFGLIYSGCVISVKSRDDKIRKFQVERKEDIGVMTSAFERYRISALL